MRLHGILTLFICHVYADKEIFHFELIREFAAKERCPYVELSGPDTDSVRNLATMESDGLAFLTQTVQESHSLCRAVLAKSEQDLETEEVEQFSHGSQASIILINGKNHSELSTAGTLRPIIYLESTLDESYTYLHVFCPQLNMPGEWTTRKRVWNARRKGFLPRDSTLDICRPALEGAPVRVAWFYSQGKPKSCFLTCLPVQYD